MHKTNIYFIITIYTKSCHLLLTICVSWKYWNLFHLRNHFFLPDWSGLVSNHVSGVRKLRDWNNIITFLNCYFTGEFGRSASEERKMDLISLTVFIYYTTYSSSISSSSLLASPFPDVAPSNSSNSPLLQTHFKETENSAILISKSF